MDSLGMDASSSSSKSPDRGDGWTYFSFTWLRFVAGFFLLNDRFIPPFLCLCVHSEEAKSTTWLHPVSGEAVVTGHRKTPGTVSTIGRLTSLSVQSV